MYVYVYARGITVLPLRRQLAATEGTVIFIHYFVFLYGLPNSKYFLTVNTLNTLTYHVAGILNATYG